MRILLTADPGIATPPKGYGGIERIVDALVRRYRALDHEVILVGQRGSTTPTSARLEWPSSRPESRLDTVRNALVLGRAADHFRPDVIHGFSRLAYLLPILGRRLPKAMSYQRHTGTKLISMAARLSGPSFAS